MPTAMDPSPTSLTINDLPSRPTPLGPGDLSDVSGGCGGVGDRCNDDKDCCGLASSCTDTSGTTWKECR
jgi:hypothetical protein